MTYDTRGRPTTDPPESNSQSDGSSSTEQSEISPEDLIAAFPLAKLQSLNQKINSPRWVVPVLPDQELECLLNYAIKLSQAGIDYECEPCVRFYRDGLTVSFTKILTDEAVNSWKLNIHNNILMLCGKLLHLCALHMKVDNTCLLDLLAIVMDAENKFHTHNAARHSELFSVQGATAEGLWGTLLDNQVFAKSPGEPRQPRGWLVDLINRFGQLGGFDNFLERFNAGIALIKKQSPATTEEIGDTPQSSSGCTSSLSLSDEASKMKTSTISSSGTNSTSTSLLLEENSKLSLPVIYLLLRPFGQCHELLTAKTIEKYFQPLWEPLIEILDNLSDDELKRDAKLEGKNDIVNGIIKFSRLLISHSPNSENLIKDLEMCRLKIILRVLQISSFNNRLTSLPDDLFEGMKMLKRISFKNNKIDFVSSQLLQPVLQNQLIRVSFENNPTIDAFFDADPENPSEYSISLPELMKLIDENCKKPIEDVTFEQFRMDFVNGMKDFWTTGMFSDFTIVAGSSSRNFPVHKNVLAIHSEFFRDVFADKADTSELKIEDLSAEAVEKVLKWMYSGRMTHDICNAFEIFALVMKLKIPRLKSRAENMVLQTLDQKNMIEVFDLGHRYNSEAFKQSSFEEIKKFLNEPDLDKKLIEKPEKLKALVEIKKNYNEMLKKLKEV